MKEEIVFVHSKGNGFEIVVQHTESGSAYGIDLSKDAYNQLRIHFISEKAELLIL